MNESCEFALAYVNFLNMHTFSFYLIVLIFGYCMLQAPLFARAIMAVHLAKPYN